MASLPFIAKFLVVLLDAIGGSAIVQVLPNICEQNTLLLNHENVGPHQTGKLTFPTYL
jgi:hypothetical protein